MSKTKQVVKIDADVALSAESFTFWMRMNVMLDLTLDPEEIKRQVIEAGDEMKKGMMARMEAIIKGKADIKEGKA